MSIKNIKRRISVLLIVVIILGNFADALPVAASESQIGGVIISFLNAPDSQTVPLGTAKANLALTETLFVKVTDELGGETDDEVSSVTWDCGDYDPDTAGIYFFSAVIPDEYTLADGLSAPAVEITVAAPDEEDSKPDSDPGADSNTYPNYDNPVVIVSFDHESHPNPEDSGITYITVDLGTAVEEIPFPMTLAATIEGGGENEYAVAVEQWECKDYDPDTTGVYEFTASLALKENESLAENVVPPIMEVVIPEIMASSEITFSGGDGTEQSPYQITDAAQLAALAAGVNEGNTDYNDKYYILNNDIDLSGYASGEGWVSIGLNDICPFKGRFDGNGHKITSLTINHANDCTDCLYHGLFGYIEVGAVKSLGIEEVSVNGNSYAGGLAGYISDSNITDCYVTGTVSGSTNMDNIGGLVGQAHLSSITNCYSECTVSGPDDPGDIDVRDNAGNGVGGLAGSISDCIVTGCYATGKIDGKNSGGLIGTVYGSSNVENCYATGEVSGFDIAGGLVGVVVSDSAIIANCYATGKVSGLEEANAGGIAGRINGAALKNCAALNPKISYAPEAGRSADFAERIAGTDDEAVLAGNYAFDGIKNVNGAASWRNKGADKKDGADISAADIKSPDFWVNPEGLNWDESVWEFADGNLPILRDIAGSQTSDLPPHLDTTDVSVTGLNLNKISAGIKAGELLTLIAAVTPEDASVKAITWSSDNTDAAIVDENGVVTGVGGGVAEITATTVDGGKAMVCTVTVTQTVTGVTFEKENARVGVSDTMALMASVLPPSASNKDVTWSSGDTKIATVDKNGNVKGLKTGDVKITVKTKDGGFTAVCNVTVYKSVKSITLNKTTESLKPGDKLQLEAKSLPEDAENKGVTWSSDSPGVAAVDGSGMVTAIAPGIAVITAKADDDAGKTAICTVMVYTPVESISLNKTIATLKPGEILALDAKVTPSEATNKNLRWLSSDAKVVSVDNEGNVKAVAAGTAKITASTTDGNIKSAVCIVTVTPIESPEITIDKPYSIITAGDTVTLKANRTAKWSIVRGGSIVGFTGYDSRNRINNVALKAVKATETEYMTGNATITAEYENSGVKYTATAVVEVVSGEAAFALIETKTTVNAAKEVGALLPIRASFVPDGTENVELRKGGTKLTGFDAKLSGDKRHIEISAKPGTGNVSKAEVYIGNVPAKEKLDITVTEKYPKITLAFDGALNAFYPVRTARVTAKAADGSAVTVEKVKNADAKGFVEVGDDGLTLKPVKAGSAGVEVTLKLDGYRSAYVKNVNTVKFTAKVVNIAPKLKLSASSAPVFGSKAVKASLLSADTKTAFSDYGVSNVVLSAVDSKGKAATNADVTVDYNAANSVITITPNTEITKSGSALLKVAFYGTDAAVYLTLKLPVISAAKLVPSSKIKAVTANKKHSDSNVYQIAAIPITLNAANVEYRNWEIVSVTEGKKNTPFADSALKDAIEATSGANELTLNVKSADELKKLAADNQSKTYTLNIGSPSLTNNKTFAVKLTVTGKESAMTVSLKGKVDIADPKSGITATVKLVNTMSDIKDVKLFNPDGTAGEDIFTVFDISGDTFKIKAADGKLITPGVARRIRVKVTLKNGEEINTPDNKPITITPAQTVGKVWQSAKELSLHRLIPQAGAEINLSLLTPTNAEIGHAELDAAVIKNLKLTAGGFELVRSGQNSWTIRLKDGQIPKNKNGELKNCTLKLNVWANGTYDGLNDDGKAIPLTDPGKPDKNLSKPSSVNVKLVFDKYIQKTGNGGNPTTGEDAVSSYSVTDVRLDNDGGLSAEVLASGACTLDIRILEDVTDLNGNAVRDWTSGAQIAAANAGITESKNKEFVAVDFAAELPEYFVVVASLSDSYGTTLFEPTVFLTYTQAYSKYKNLTTADFDPDRILSMDGDETDNFMALKKGVARVTAGEGGKNVLTVNAEGAYIFTNADETVSGLNEGDCLTLIDNNGELVLIKVKSVEASGGTVTVTAADGKIEISDFFDCIKIHIGGGGSQDLARAGMAARGGSDGKLTFNTVIINKEYEYLKGTPLEIKGIISAKLTPEVSFEHDGKLLGPSYYAASVKVKIEDVDIGLKIESDIDLYGGDLIEIAIDDALGEADKNIGEQIKEWLDDTIFSIIKPEITTSITLKLSGKAEIPSIGIEGNAEVGVDVKKTGGDKLQSNLYSGNIAGKAPLKVKDMISDSEEFSVKIGPVIGAKVNLFKYNSSIDDRYAIEAGLTTNLGFYLESRYEPKRGDGEKHSCTDCLPVIMGGYCDVTAELGGKWLSDDKDGKEIKLLDAAPFLPPISRRFNSIKNPADSVLKGKPTTGWGECPNIEYKVNFNPVFEDGTPAEGISIQLDPDPDYYPGYLLGGYFNGLKPPTWEGYKYSGGYTQNARSGLYFVIARDADGNTVGLTKFLVTAKHLFMLQEIPWALSTLFPALEKGQKENPEWEKVYNKDRNVQIIIEKEPITTDPDDPDDPDKDVSTVNGSVQDKTYNPVEGAAVKAYAGSAPVAETTTDSDGKYTMELPAGTYTIKVTAEGYRPGSILTMITAGKTYNMAPIVLRDESGGADITVSTYTDLVNAIEDAAKPTVIEIAGDIVLPSTQSDIAINGKDITLTTTQGTTRSLSIRGFNDAVQYRGYYLFLIYDGGSLTIEDGVIFNGSVNVCPLVQGMEPGTFTMNGGKINGDVNVDFSGSFVMNDGEINGASGSQNYWNGVRVHASSSAIASDRYGEVSFIMNGGKIRNAAVGVTVENQSRLHEGSATFVMLGGEICDNTTSGVALSGYSDDYITNQSLFIMQNGEIHNNGKTIGDEGNCGVHVNSSGVFTMNGGKIYNNLNAQYSGVRLLYDGSFNMTGGEIYGNQFGVYYDQRYTGTPFKKTGGTIIGNSQADVGGPAVPAGAEN